MLLDCLKCRRNTESKNPKVVKTKNGRIMLLSKCSVCDSKKSRFIKEQEASALLYSLGIKTPLSKIPLVVPINKETGNSRYIYQNELDKAYF